jgi:ABC-type multidrug transport system permease subunit
MLYCLAAGRLMTADCLSREKREGTLGLLFLTDLKGYDVVLGKLAATSLDGFYGLLAVFPLAGHSAADGGMTNGELWRMVLVLVNTFLFSLAIGLFVSAVNRDEQKAMGRISACSCCWPPCRRRWRHAH